jgi:hypothetical protein
MMCDTSQSPRTTRLRFRPAPLTRADKISSQGYQTSATTNPTTSYVKSNDVDSSCPAVIIPAVGKPGKFGRHGRRCRLNSLAMLSRDTRVQEFTHPRSPGNDDRGWQGCSPRDATSSRAPIRLHHTPPVASLRLQAPGERRDHRLRREVVTSYEDRVHDRRSRKDL